MAYAFRRIFAVRRRGPFPAVLMRTPYSNAGVRPWRARLIRDGYALVKQDCRGRFDSEGCFQPFREADDGHDAIAWIRDQAWCDGRIGMFGGSYLGLTQFAAAWTQPAGLLAITPAVMGCDSSRRCSITMACFNWAWLRVGDRCGRANRAGK